MDTGVLEDLNTAHLLHGGCDAGRVANVRNSAPLQAVDQRALAHVRQPDDACFKPSEESWTCEQILAREPRSVGVQHAMIPLWSRGAVDEGPSNVSAAPRGPAATSRAGEEHHGKVNMRTHGFVVHSPPKEGSSAVVAVQEWQFSSGALTHGDGGLQAGVARIVFQQLQQRVGAKALGAGHEVATTAADAAAGATAALGALAARHGSLRRQVARLLFAAKVACH